jgi:hypothetical protein
MEVCLRMSQAQEVKQSLDEVRSLLAHLETARWVEADWGRLLRVLRSYARLLVTLFEAQITLKRLQALVFGQRRRPSSSAAPGAGQGLPGDERLTGAAGTRAAGAHKEEGSADARREAGRGASDTGVELTPSGGHRPGSGRLEVEAYVGAERVECRHEALAVGERCPVCGQGRLYRLPPGVEIRIDGNALLTAIRYEVEKLRCSACGQVFTAQRPAEAGAEQ